jgi:hypothetical protein
MVDDNRRWLPLATFPNSAAPAVANFAIAFLTEAISFTSNSTSPVSASDKRMRATPAKLAIRIWLAPSNFIHHSSSRQRTPPQTEV